MHATEAMEILRSLSQFTEFYWEDEPDDCADALLNSITGMVVFPTTKEVKTGFLSSKEVPANALKISTQYSTNYGSEDIYLTGDQIPRFVRAQQAYAALLGQALDVRS